MKKLIILLIVASAFIACTTNTSSSDTKVWKVTIDLGPGSGLSKTVYDVKDGDTLKQSDIQGTPVFDVTKDLINNTAPVGRVFSGYTKTDGSTFTLDSTTVNDNITITAQWGFDPKLDCSGIDKPETKLFDFANTDNIIGVACALKYGAKLSDKNPYNNGFTALLYAADYNYFELIKYLVASGANVQQSDNSGITPLLQVSGTGKIDTIKYLLAHGADINEKATYGTTPLIAAVGSVSPSSVWNSDDSKNTIKFLATYTGVNLAARMTAGSNINKTALGVAKAKSDELPSDTIRKEILNYLTTLYTQKGIALD